MKAGRELDVLVAEKVMGLEFEQKGESVFDEETGDTDWNYRRTHESWDLDDPHNNYLPQYSQNIRDAWEVVEKMSPNRWLGLSEYRDGWRAIFSSTKGKVPLHPVAEATTAPLAICLAALKAVE